MFLSVTVWLVVINTANWKNFWIGFRIALKMIYLPYLQNSESLASKVASLLSQANRSPLVTASSTCQRTNSDPQPSSSQSSSPCPLRHRPSHYTPQQPVNSCPKRLPHDLPSVSSASSLLPDPVSSRCTNSSVPYERRLSLQNERPSKLNPGHFWWNMFRLIFAIRMKMLRFFLYSCRCFVAFLDYFLHHITSRETDSYAV